MTANFQPQSTVIWSPYRYTSVFRNRLPNPSFLHTWSPGFVSRFAILPLPFLRGRWCQPWESTPPIVENAGPVRDLKLITNGGTVMSVFAASGVPKRAVKRNFLNASEDIMANTYSVTSHCGRWSAHLVFQWLQLGLGTFYHRESELLHQPSRYGGNL